MAAAAIGGIASLLSALVTSNSASKAGKAQRALSQQGIDIQRDQLNLARAQDAKRNSIVDEMNQSRRGRGRTADRFFNAFSREVSSMDINQGVADAVSEIEGTSGRQRRSLRTDMGGGQTRLRSGTLSLATNRARSQVVNQITSQNLNKKLSFMAQLSSPVDLAVPGELTASASGVGGAINNLSNIYGNQANQLNQAAGQQSSAGIQMLMNSYNNQNRNNGNNTWYDSPGTGSGYDSYNFGRPSAD